MTAAQIHRRYKGEWILVVDPHVDESLQVLAGKVLCHSKDRDEVYQIAVKKKPKRWATLFTGTMPKGTAIIL